MGREMRQGRLLQILQPLRHVPASSCFPIWERHSISASIRYAQIAFVDAGHATSPCSDLDGSFVQARAFSSVPSAKEVLPGAG